MINHAHNTIRRRRRDELLAGLSAIILAVAAGSFLGVWLAAVLAVVAS